MPHSSLALVAAIAAVLLSVGGCSPLDVEGGLWRCDVDADCVNGHVCDLAQRTCTPATGTVGGGADVETSGLDAAGGGDMTVDAPAHDADTAAAATDTDEPSEIEAVDGVLVDADDVTPDSAGPMADVMGDGVGVPGDVAETTVALDAGVDSAGPDDGVTTDTTVSPGDVVVDLQDGSWDADDAATEEVSADAGPDAVSADTGPAADDAADDALSTSSYPNWTCPEGFTAYVGGSCLSADGSQLFLPYGFTFVGCNTSSNAANVEDCSMKFAHPIDKQLVSPFLIDRTEVTVADYAACVVGLGCLDPKQTWPNKLDANYPERTDHPVNYVTRSRAEDYCQHTGKRLCHPTEWEYAARGGCMHIPAGVNACKPNVRKFPWGNDDPTCDLAVIKTGSDVNGCGSGLTSEVGSRPAGDSPFGLADMAGNVAEFVASLDEPITGSPDLEIYDLHRGGSLKTDPTGLSMSWGFPNDSAEFFVGFRCCQDPPPLDGAPEGEACAVDSDCQAGLVCLDEGCDALSVPPP